MLKKGWEGLTMGKAPLEITLKNMNDKFELVSEQ